MALTLLDSSGGPSVYLYITSGSSQYRQTLALTLLDSSGGPSVYLYITSGSSQYRQTLALTLLDSSGGPSVYLYITSGSSQYRQTLALTLLDSSGGPSVYLYITSGSSQYTLAADLDIHYRIKRKKLVTHKATSYGSVKPMYVFVAITPQDTTKVDSWHISNMVHSSCM